MKAYKKIFQQSMIELRFSVSNWIYTTTNQNIKIYVLAYYQFTHAAVGLKAQAVLFFVQTDQILSTVR